MPSANHTDDGKRPTLARALAAGVMLAIGVGSQAGCGREFFRQWADQDVSEAVFEKTRDPRFRLDTFSIEPPALARFADPYDPDRPPAPPDDRATEALSPTPQWPHFRLLVPAEGTGYLDVLEQGPKYVPPIPKPIAGLGAGGTPPPPAETPKSPAVPPATNSGPFNPGGNLGPNGGGMTPNNGPGSPADSVLPPLPGEMGSLPTPRSRSKPQDSGVLLAAYQSPAANQPGPAVNQPGPAAPLPSGVRPEQGADRLQSPTIDVDPNPGVDVGGRAKPRADLAPDEKASVVKDTTSFAAILTPGLLDFNEASASGYPSELRPYIVGPEQALQLALVNNRTYQFQLETVYTTALAVTLQRFAFQPQVFAGLTPTTPPVGGAFPLNFQNSFLYRTKEAIGGQNSTLSLSETAGFGKLLTFGGRLVGAFANQTVFNFLGSNPRQPTVQSYLPLTFVQPFLRGGGRAVTLEPLTQAERNLVYAARNFARLRQEFVPYIMTNNTIDQAGNTSDPSIGYLNVLLQLQFVEYDRRIIAAYERLFKLYQVYVEGAGTGISQIQVDQVAQQLQGQRSTLLGDEAQYRLFLDQYKIQLGLPPDLPIVLDRSPFRAFKETFNQLEIWAGRDDHDPEELPGIIEGLPDLELVVIDGRQLFRYNPQGTKLEPVGAQPEKLLDFLLAGERVALENRLDLMNFRAQLYDQWRQLVVTANALQGTLNVTVTNTINTPAATTNPFAFVDQAKNFSLVFNTELPLIRVAERNAFRLSQINYRQRQRLLMYQEDQIKYTIRSQIYALIQQSEVFEIQKNNLFVTLRQRDLTLQQIIAPPASDAGSASANQATQTNNLITALNSILGIQRQLTQLWVNYQANRLALYRDLGLMPYDEWEAFYEFFPTNSVGAKPTATGGVPAPGRPTDPTAGAGT